MRGHEPGEMTIPYSASCFQITTHMSNSAERFRGPGVAFLKGGCRNKRANYRLCRTLQVQRLGTLLYHVPEPGSANQCSYRGLFKFANENITAQIRRGVIKGRVCLVFCRKQFCVPSCKERGPHHCFPSISQLKF